MVERNISCLEVINRKWIRVVMLPEKKTTNVKKILCWRFLTVLVQWSNFNEEKLIIFLPSLSENGSLQYR